MSMHRIATFSTKVLVVALVQNYKNRKMRCEPSLSQHDAYRYKRLHFFCSEETLGLEVVYPHARLEGSRTLNRGIPSKAECIICAYTTEKSRTL